MSFINNLFKKFTDDSSITSDLNYEDENFIDFWSFLKYNRNRYKFRHKQNDRFNDNKFNDKSMKAVEWTSYYKSIKQRSSILPLNLLYSLSYTQIKSSNYRAGI